MLSCRDSDPPSSPLPDGGTGVISSPAPTGRTLTAPYNERPTWLDLAHQKLDEAVFDAYDWPHDLGDQEVLERLLALNLERAKTS